jgi:polar amino acid transport system substrate-binding protein
LINTQKGLAHLVGNVGLYKKILHNFVAEFQGLQIDLQDQESARIIHTLKGLSGNIGAAALQQTCREFEEHWDVALLPQLYEQLQSVIAEIKHNIPVENSFVTDSGEKIAAAFFSERIAGLKVALSRRRSRECVPIIEEIKQYQLSLVQTELLSGLDKLIQARDFKAALALLEGDDGEKTNDSGS